MKGLALQLPGGVEVLLGDLCLKLGRLGLGDFHAVERSHHLDVALCGAWKDVSVSAKGLTRDGCAETPVMIWKS